MQMQDRLLFVLSPPRAGSTLLQQMLASHSQIATAAEPHLITPLAYLGYHDLVDKAPYDHINAAEAIREFVGGLPNGEQDYLDALRCYTDTLYGRMLQKSGKRYFMDKTPAYALVLPFLRKLYPDARYLVLTRNPIAVMSSYANSFFDGDWQAANDYNPVVNRYVPAIARFLREPTSHVRQVGYEALVKDPEAELERIFRFLDLPNEPGAVNYGEHFGAGRAHTKAGSGDPISVGERSRPTTESLEKWTAELRADDQKLALAREIIAKLNADDLRIWGYDKAELLRSLELGPGNGGRPAHKKPKLNNFVMQRKIMLALKKDIDKRPHGKLLQRVRYYCNVLLRE
jgi:hypothetical protein